MALRTLGFLQWCYAIKESEKTVDPKPSPTPEGDQRRPAPVDPEFARAENEDDDGYDPWSDRRPTPEPLFERDPWS